MDDFHPLPPESHHAPASFQLGADMVCLRPSRPKVQKRWCLSEMSEPPCVDEVSTNMDSLLPQSLFATDSVEGLGGRSVGANR